MAEAAPGPGSVLPPAPPAEPRARRALPACCGDDDEDDDEHEHRQRRRRQQRGGSDAHARAPAPDPAPPEPRQLNGLVGADPRPLPGKKAASAPHGAPGPHPAAPGATPARRLHGRARTADAPATATATATAAAARNGLPAQEELERDQQQQQQQHQEEEELEPQEEGSEGGAPQVRLLASSLAAGCSLRGPSAPAPAPAPSSACEEAAAQPQPQPQPQPAGQDRTIRYVRYESELQMPDIMRLITKDLSEPYSIYTYRYFIHNWPQLCFLAMVGEECVGAIVCKLDMHKKMFRRGYIAMLAVDSKYRRNGIGTNLVKKAIYAMVEGDCDEVVLETEITNKSALKLYENLGFVRDKRLFRYYLNGVDALRLKLWLR